MKTQIIIGVMAAALLFMNKNHNIGKEDNENDLSSNNMIVEAIVKFYPGAPLEGAEVLMKSERFPYKSGSENLDAGREIKPDMDGKKYIINTDHF